MDRAITRMPVLKCVQMAVSVRSCAQVRFSFLSYFSMTSTGASVTVRLIRNCRFAHSIHKISLNSCSV